MSRYFSSFREKLLVSSHDAIEADSYLVRQFIAVLYLQLIVFHIDRTLFNSDCTGSALENVVAAFGKNASYTVISYIHNTVRFKVNLQFMREQLLVSRSKSGVAYLHGMWEEAAIDDGLILCFDSNVQRFYLDRHSYGLGGEVRRLRNACLDRIAAAVYRYLSERRICTVLVHL